MKKMSLFNGKDRKNMFCRERDLRNESDVEQFFVIRLLANLEFKDKEIHTKEQIEERIIGKGRKRKNYKPDYLLYIGKDPVVAIDVKHPEIDANEGLVDALNYAAVINREYKGTNPIQYCMGTNGIVTKLCKWDENKPVIVLKLEDFKSGNEKYRQLKGLVSYIALKRNLNKLLKEKPEFEFRKPGIAELKGIFTACHNLIWRKQKIAPAEAFYEFSKVLFVKLNEDKRIHKRLKGDEDLSLEDFTFSVGWIDRQTRDPDPVNNQLFKVARNELENEILKKRRKRIFERNEEIRINSPVIREVIKLLEHLDLFAVDEDLHGRVFETFLSATVRGKELGQFFTPRTVVEFMVNLADLEVDKDYIAMVLDACCGSGGFLIYAMRDILRKIAENKSLTNIQKRELEEKIKNGCLYGIDDYEKIVRIARMNMYIHGDSGNYIYKLDSLDKNFIKVKDERDKEIRENAQELWNKLREGLKFDVVLTNPPFAMKYEKSDPKDRGVLREYDCAYSDLNESGERESAKMRASLKSNVMFIERYYDLLKGGILISV